MRNCFRSAMLIAALSLPAAAEEPFSFAATPGQLPKTVVPEDYTLSVVPDIRQFTFQGNVVIRLNVREPVDRIVLNALDLEVDSAVLSATDAAPATLRSTLDARRQTLALSMGRKIAPGAYVLTIAYRGRIYPQTHGFYYGRYNTPTGEKIMLATQMEPTDARRMLPCWDEPVFRASFQTSVDLPESWSAYSNMPAEGVQHLPGGLKRTRFHRTPKMASYLLVLVAGEFERLDAEQDGVSLGIVTLQGKRQTGKYAAEATRRLLPYYNGYFGVAYPLPKLDQLALPGTAGFGGMENWGAIAYDEAVLLFDERSSAPGKRREIFDTVAHEIAHQWFGNLVTMAWWDNLWLNEGFASWMAAKAMDRFNPDWNVWQHANDDRERAMNLDARKTTHPIQQPVKDESAAVDAFDVITYRKGQSFLRMLETWLGEETFRTGIRTYVSKHAYSSTTTADLWGALEQASGKPVRRVARNWTEQPGFPVIKVDARCADGTQQITLRQEQFKVDEARAGPRLWVIPVAVSTGGATTFELLDQRTRVLTRRACRTLVVDPDALGYFRVEYSPGLLADLAGNWSRLTLATRLKLLSDAWALAGVGRLPLARYLAFVDQARNDTEPMIWNEIVARLLKLDALAQGETVQVGLRAFGVDVLRPRLQLLGWEAGAGDSQEVLELRPKLIAVLGRFGERGVRAEAQARFKRFLKEPASLPAVLADPVTAIAGRFADAATYEALLVKLREAPGSEEQLRYLSALAAAQDAQLARQTLQLSLGEVLPPSLATLIPGRVAVDHLALAWSFVREHRENYQRRVTMLDANYYFGGVVARSADSRIADELEAWARQHLPSGAMTETRRIADGIRANARFKAILLPQLVAELDPD